MENDGTERIEGPTKQHARPWQKQESFKPKNKGVPFEDCKKDLILAFSFNPKLQTYADDPRLFMRETYNRLRSIAEGVKLTLWLESSNTARLHYHGLLQIVDIYAYLTFLRRLEDQGTYCIKHLFDADAEHNKWDVYMRKQQDHWLAYYNEHCTREAYMYPLVIDNRAGNFPSKCIVSSVKQRNN